MDYKKLADDLLSECEENCADCEYAEDIEYECAITQLAAKAITELLARAEAAEARLEKVEKEKNTVINDLRVCSIEGFMECQYCLYRTARSFCWDCTDGSNWRYRGEMENEYENK